MPTWDKDKMREWMRKRRIQRREQGLCIVCGARPSKAGKVTCEVCIKRNTLITKRIRASKTAKKPIKGGEDG